MSIFNVGGNGSKKNHRKYPGVRGKRPDLKKIRQTEALERQAQYDALSLEQKMKINPKKYMKNEEGKIVRVAKKA
ncbi:MAG: hypothetical protein KGH64_04270 [Candidatus Micrarchaeota archaeon]|nr:hypothetical protein [Candidatus Micrarchaeota archaeon]